MQSDSAYHEHAVHDAARHGPAVIEKRLQLDRSHHALLFVLLVTFVGCGLENHVVLWRRRPVRSTRAGLVASRGARCTGRCEVVCRPVLHGQRHGAAGGVDALALRADARDPPPAHEDAPRVSDELVLVRGEDDALAPLESQIHDGGVEEATPHAGVDGGERVIKQEDVRVAVEHPRQRDARPLAPRQLHALVAHDGVLAVPQLGQVNVQPASGNDARVVLLVVLYPKQHVLPDLAR